MVELTWLGHACFRLRGRDVAIVLDPVGKRLGYDISKVRPDIVTVSHDHPGHNNTAALKGEFTLVDGPGEYEIKDVFITGIRTYHDGERGARAGRNTVYVIHLDDLVFCHLGDLGHTLSSEQLEQIGHVDVLMAPVDGSTLPISSVVEVISQIEPGIVVPMHYKAGSEGLAKFSREMGLHEALPQDKLTLRKSDIPEQTQVVVLTDRVA